MKSPITELLAPAGKPEALIAAVQNGADAVYLGEKSFSARKNAVNFSWEEIADASAYCHIRGVKVYLALNTLTSDSELPAVENAVVNAVNSGVDAVIVQDFGVASIIRSICPDLPIHASTQLTASNTADVAFLESKGFSRVVLSRELSYSEISEISKNTSVELEAFVHGALCISFSGKCLMSSFIGGRSGNRGLCAQPCRKRYRSSDKIGFFLSPRDLCLADEISAIKKSGVTSFKIEGRMKNPEYVAAVTSVYRKYIDAPAPLSADDKTVLKKIFVRGDDFTKGYFSDLNTPEIMNYNISNDNITSRTDKELLHSLKLSYTNTENKKIPVDGFLSVKENQRAFFSLTDSDGNNVISYGEIAQEAINAPLTEESASARMCKLGQTPFAMQNISVDIDANLMLPASQLNNLRRECCALLEKKRSEIPHRSLHAFSYQPAEKPIHVKRPRLTAVITSAEQFSAVQDADIISVPLHLWDKIPVNEKCALQLPAVIINSSEIINTVLRINPPQGIYTSSYGIAAALHGKTVIHGDFGLNVYNTLTAKELSDVFDSLTLSPELSLTEISYITAGTSVFCNAVVYGKMPLMVSRACLLRGITGKCNCQKPVKLQDETGAVFTIYGDPLSHLNTVTNSVPTFMADKLSLLKKSGTRGLNLIFTDETAYETRKIMQMYLGKAPAEKPAKFTRGYFMNKKEACRFTHSPLLP